MLRYNSLKPNYLKINNTGSENVDIGNILREKREGMGYSVQRLAELLKVEEVCISNWESNKEQPDLTRSILLCRLYGESLNDMFAEVQTESILGKQESSDFDHACWLNRMAKREFF